MKKLRPAAFVLAGGLAGSMPSAAQDSSTYYTVVHADQFVIDWKGFYDWGDARTAEVRKQLPHHLDLAFGKHAKQRLDLYLPENAPADAPVFLFLHGGGMREGDRAHYGYLARPFAEQGILTALASYRLTPEHRYPDQPNDVRDAVEWLFRNVSKFGGDPRKIYVGGHSAGAFLTATVCADLDWLEKRSLPPEAIRGCATISSGGYEISESFRREEYLPDFDKRIEASPLRNVKNPPPRMVVAVGSLEQDILEPSHEFAKKLEQSGASVKVVIEDDMDHAQIVAALGDGKSKLARAVLEMIQSPASEASPSRNP